MIGTSVVLEETRDVVVIRVMDREITHDTGRSIGALAVMPVWLHGNEVPKIVLDLSNITFISNIGLMVLIVLLKRVKVAGGQLVIAGLTDQCGQVMSVAGLDRAFDCYTTPDEAVAALLAGRCAAGTAL